MTRVGQVFATSYSSFSGGVAILICKKLAFRSFDCVKDSQGRYILVKQWRLLTNFSGEGNSSDDN